MCGSMATQKSSCSIAWPRRLPPGEDSTGLPAYTTIARTWPSPGVVISSTRPATGNSPFMSGWPLTRWRAVRCLPATPTAEPSLSTVPTSTGGLGNIAPPGTSRFPVTAFSTLISQCVSEPVCCWQTPTRP